MLAPGYDRTNALNQPPKEKLTLISLASKRKRDKIGDDTEASGCVWSGVRIICCERQSRGDSQLVTNLNTPTHLHPLTHPLTAQHTRTAHSAHQRHPKNVL